MAFLRVDFRFAGRADNATVETLAAVALALQAACAEAGLDTRGNGVSASFDAEPVPASEPASEPDPVVEDAL